MLIKSVNVFRLKMKKVSIICPFFNEDDILEETILAFMDQTYKNKEIILLYNAHPGRKCTEIAKKYAKKYKWIKYYYVKNIPGKWATHYYMEAMKHATGEVIYMADANAKIMRCPLSWNIFNVIIFNPLVFFRVFFRDFCTFSSWMSVVEKNNFFIFIGLIHKR